VPRDSPGPACSAAPGSGRQGGSDQAAVEAEEILISCSWLYQCDTDFLAK
jgi:hypothetical protein